MQIATVTATLAAITASVIVGFLLIHAYLQKRKRPAPVDRDAEILKVLKDLSDGLIYVSESEHPFVVVEMDFISHLFSSIRSNPTLKTQMVGEFFRNHTNIEYHYQAPFFTILQNFIESTLKDVKVYRTGEIEITAYILGKAPSGNYVGLKTTLIET